MKLKYDEPLSQITFNFNLRLYIVDSSFVNNSARADGGGINSAMSTVYINRGTFVRCKAGRGAAIRARISRVAAQSGYLAIAGRGLHSSTFQLNLSRF